MSFAVNDSPYRRPRRRQGAEPRHPRPARARGRGQCRDPRHHGRRQRQLRGRRPRRAPARRAHRDAAPRRLRARRSAARASCSATAPTAARSPTRPSSSTSTTNSPAPSSTRWRCARREMTDMRPSGGGKTRLTFSRPEPRPDRLSRRVPVRHARHRHHEPPVRELRPVQGPDPGPPERRAHLDGAGRRRSPTRSTCSRSAACCSSRPARCSTKAWSSARTPSRRTSRSTR